MTGLLKKQWLLTFCLLSILIFLIVDSISIPLISAARCGCAAGIGPCFCGCACFDADCDCGCDYWEDNRYWYCASVCYWEENYEFCCENFNMCDKAK